MMKYLQFLFFAFLLPVFACKDDTSYDEQLEIDKQIIRQYLADNNIQADSLPSGLYYVITKEGSGGSPTFSSTVIVGYKGMLMDGTVFDQTQSGVPRTFYLGNLITGWQLGIPLLQKTGRGTFYIPSGLAYGTSGSAPTIPANAPLIFEIELVDFY